MIHREVDSLTKCSNLVILVNALRNGINTGLGGSTMGQRARVGREKPSQTAFLSFLHQRKMALVATVVSPNKVNTINWLQLFYMHNPIPFH